jgi:uncharacterized protein DUF4124
MPAKKISDNRLGAVPVSLLMLGIWFSLVSPSCAETYSWTDETGVMHFTDTPEAIPKQYRKKAKVSAEEQSGSWEYLATDSGADYYYDPSRVAYSDRSRYSVVVKESYARSGREEYETLAIIDCARQLYKPVQSTRILDKQRSPVSVGRSRQDSWEGGGGFKRFIHPYLVLSRIVCQEREE